MHRRRRVCLSLLFWGCPQPVGACHAHTDTELGGCGPACSSYRDQQRHTLGCLVTTAITWSLLPGSGGRRDAALGLGHSNGNSYHISLPKRRPKTDWMSEWSPAPHVLMPDTNRGQESLLREKENIAQTYFFVLIAGSIFSLIKLKAGNDKPSYLFIAFC